jgi:hypothetical protein
MSEQKGKTVQLEGEELERMRKVVKSAEDNLRQIAKTVRSKISGAESHSPKSARFIFNNLRVVIEDEYGCGVYEDPPGISRPCKPGE